jgi:cytochrome P450
MSLVMSRSTERQQHRMSTADGVDAVVDPVSKEAGASITRLGRDEEPAIVGYAAVKAAAHDWTLYSSEFQDEQDVRGYRQYPLESDPPAHSEYRAILTPFLHRQRIGELEPPIRAIAADLVRQLASAGQGETVEDLAMPMVVKSLGVAFGRPQDVDEWTGWGPRVFERDGQRDGRHLDAYLNRVFDEVEQTPGSDLFSHISASLFQGRSLSRLEKLGFGSVVLAGGRDTVVGLITCAIWHLGLNPAERRRLVHDRAGIPRALDEFLRYLTPLPNMHRKVTRDVAGFAAESQVSLSFISANHDPAIFADPGAIKLERQPNHHLAFGNGPHTCIGAHLGKLEARVLLEELLSAVPNFQIGKDVRIEWQTVGDTRVPSQFLAVPIRVSP